jgi:hypothetical protein
MLKTNTVTFVRLSDVLAYMGYPELMEDASDIFSGVTWGDSMHTIVRTEYVLNILFYWLDSAFDETWTDDRAKEFMKKDNELVAIHPFVDMES